MRTWYGIDLRIVLADRRTGNANLEHVLAVDRKVVLNRDAGARIEGQIVADPLVARPLQRIALGVVNIFDRLQRDVADGEPADSARRRHVALEQRGRRRQHGRDVVEPVSGIVDRQPRARLDVDGQQVANGVAVLGAVQPMDRRAPRIRLRGRGRVERRSRGTTRMPPTPRARDACGRSAAASRPTAPSEGLSPRSRRARERRSGSDPEAIARPSSSCRCDS